MARKKIRNWIAISILFLTLVALVVTGFGTDGTGGMGSLAGGSGPQGTELARVGSTTIGSTAANDRFNASFQQTQQQMIDPRTGQSTLQIDEFLAQGGFEGAVDFLIGTEVMRQFAATHGVVVTRRMQDRFIVTSPEFQFARIGDNFDNNLFQRALQQAGYTEAAIRADISRTLLQRQLITPIQTGFRAPAGVIRAHAAVPFEQRSGQIGVVPVGGIQRGLNPSDAEIAAYYQRYRDYFAVPERRVVKYALIGVEQVNVEAPTDAEVRAVYANTPRYQQSETRTLQSITFSGAQAQQQADAFAARVRRGTSFVDAAGGAGFQASDITFANQSQAQFATVTNADISAQAFRGAQGGLIGPVRSPLGVHVVRVEAILRSSGQPIEAVRPAIVAELERRKRSAAINALATQIETQIAEGASFEDAARNNRLQVVTTPAITARGLLSNGRPVADLSAAVRGVLTVAFEMDSDSSEPVVAVLQENARYALVGVERTEAAAAPPLAEIRDRVRAQLVSRTALRRAREIADAIAARINAGTPVAQAFAQAGIPLPAPETINTRRLAIMAANAPEALRLFFRLRPGTAGVVAAPNNGGWMIAIPQRSVRGTDAEAAQAIPSLQQDLTQAIPLEAGLQLLRAMEISVGTQRNQEAIRAERARIAASMGATPGP